MWTFPGQATWHENINGIGNIRPCAHHEIHQRTSAFLIFHDVDLGFYQTWQLQVCYHWGLDWVPAVADHISFLFWGKPMKWPSTALASNFLRSMSGTCTYTQHPKIRRCFTDGFLKWKILYGVSFSDSAYVGSLFRIFWVYCTANGHKFLGKFDLCIMVLIISKMVLLRYSATLFSCRVFAYDASPWTSTILEILYPCIHHLHQFSEDWSFLLFLFWSVWSTPLELWKPHLCSWFYPSIMWETVNKCHKVLTPGIAFNVKRSIDIRIDLM